MFRMDMSGTKWDIFLASLDLFSREGYHNVSMAEIANAAGIRASSIYNHFSCKDALLETMYKYYDYYAANFMPSLESLFKYMEVHPPRETLRKAMFYVDPRAEDIMSQIFVVAASLNGDVRAKMLIQKNIFAVPKVYLTSLLNRMIEEKMIREFDVDIFVFIYCSLWHSVNMRHAGSSPVDASEWRRVVDHLLDQVVEPEKARGNTGSGARKAKKEK